MKALDAQDLEVAFGRAWPHLQKGVAANGQGGLRFDAALVADPSVCFGITLGNPGRQGREFSRLNRLKLGASMEHLCSTRQLPDDAALLLQEKRIHEGAIYDPDLGVVVSLTGFGPYGNVSWGNFIMTELRDIQAKKVDAAA